MYSKKCKYCVNMKYSVNVGVLCTSITSLSVLSCKLNCNNNNKKKIREKMEKEIQHLQIIFVDSKENMLSAYYSNDCYFVPKLSNATTILQEHSVIFRINLGTRTPSSPLANNYM